MGERITDERMRYIAQAVCDYADAHGYARDKDVDEIVEDLEFVFEFECPDEVIYLYDFIDYDSGPIWNLVSSVWQESAIPSK